MSARHSHNAAFYNTCGAVDWMHPLNQRLASWYICLPGANSGPTWFDLCGNIDGSLTLLDVNTAWEGSTRSGSWGALKMDGVDGYLSLPSSGGLNAIQTASIALWVRWTGTQDQGFGTNYGPAIGRQSGASFSNHLLSLSTNNPDTALIRWAPYINSTYACTSTSNPGDRRWRHLVVTYSSGAHALYVDGVQESTGSTTGTMGSDASAVLGIGAWNGIGGGYANASFDCVRIWPNRILNPHEAWDEYQRTQYYADGLLLTRKTRNRAFVTSTIYSRRTPLHSRVGSRGVS